MKKFWKILLIVLAVLLAELVGEIIERMSRGRQRDEKRVFDGGDFRERGRSK